jgi:hypothetical protein
VADPVQFEKLWKSTDNAVALIPAEDMQALNEHDMPYYVLGKTSSLVAIGRKLPSNTRDHVERSVQMN